MKFEKKLTEYENKNLRMKMTTGAKNIVNKILPKKSTKQVETIAPTIVRKDSIQSADASMITKETKETKVSGIKPPTVIKNASLAAGAKPR